LSRAPPLGNTLDGRHPLGVDQGDTASYRQDKDVAIERQQVLQVAIELIDGRPFAALFLRVLESLELAACPGRRTLGVLDTHSASQLDAF
jgi:hypothetical protein